MPQDEIASALKLLLEKDVKWVDLQFTDLFGKLRHVTIPASDVTEESFKTGFGKLDGSSIRGFTTISESDMVLMPIASTMSLVPWTPGMARMLTQVYKGAEQGRFEKDPRAVAEAAEKHQEDLGYTSFFGPELEFFMFDRVDIDMSNPSSGTGYKLYAREAPWSDSGTFHIKHKDGYYPTPPQDQLHDARLAIVDMLRSSFGFQIEATHHEVATAGQGEISFRYSTVADCADKVQTLKYVAKNVAHANNLTATFIPKPFYGDNGSGMHTHFSVWSKDLSKNIMYDNTDAYSEFSQEGRYIIGGILEHARALSAIVSPTVNSYHRLIPGFEAPVYLAWSRGNRSAVVRIPSYFKGSASAKRIEYRAPDPSCNPYLAFSAMLMAGLDGLKKKMDPGEPVDENIYTMNHASKTGRTIRELPRSLADAVDSLESDHEFLKPVFGNSLIETYIELKREELMSIAAYPHPVELYSYLDV